MFERTRMPVTVFKSSDAGAPPAYGDNGFVDVYAVLKACLADGYGEKQALGWAVKFDNAAKKSAHFVSQHPKCNGWGLSITHDLNGIYTELIMVKEATGLLSGSFINKYSQSSNYTHVTGHSSYKKQSDWMLVGNALGFVLISSMYSTAKMEILYFSQCPSLGAGDAHNTVLVFSNSGIDNKLTSYNSSYNYNSTNIVCAASYYGYSSSNYIWNSRFRSDSFRQDDVGKISNAILFDEIFLHESASSSNYFDLRMVFPGVLSGNVQFNEKSLINLATLPKVKLNGADDFCILSSATTYYSSSSYSVPYLFINYAINLTAWEM